MPDRVVKTPWKNLTTLQIEMKQDWVLVLLEDELYVDLIYKKVDQVQLWTRPYIPQKDINIQNEKKMSDKVL
eukprot:2590057-Ditylum_brightwellii.AAC.1